MEKAYDESHRAVVDKHLARFASETWDTQEEGDNHGSLEATLETNGYLERLRQKKQSVKELIKARPLDFIPQGLVEEILETPKMKRSRQSRPRCGDYWTTKWGGWLEDPSTAVPGSRNYKKFVRRFRMPLLLFNDLVSEVVAHNVFDMKYNSRIPVEIKCLIALRILGRGSCCDDMEEMSGVAESTCNYIFHQFIEGVATKLFSKYVYPPEMGTPHFDNVTNTYAKMGFPGCVGSVDCTHIYWDKCPVELTNLCKRQDKPPSLSYEMVCDHSTRVHSCTEGFVGTSHDGLVVVNDLHMQQIYHGMYKDFQYSLYTEDGGFVTFHGGYVMSDNGYQDSWMFMKPNPNAMDERTVYIPFIILIIPFSILIIFLRLLLIICISFKHEVK